MTEENFLLPLPKKRKLPISSDETQSQLHNSPTNFNLNKSPNKLEPMSIVEKEPPALEIPPPVATTTNPRKGGWKNGDKAKEKEMYNPSKPNDYELIIQDRKKREIEQQIKRRKIKELRAIEKQREKQKPNIDLDMSGQDVYLMRAKRSGLLSNEEETDISKKSNSARKMMEKWGWTKGMGLGKEEQGITTPLITKKTAKSSGIIVPSSIPQQVDQEKRSTAVLGNPTRVVMLRNMIMPDEIDEELEAEIISECVNYGAIDKVHIHVMTSEEVKQDEKVRIFVMFGSKESSMKALIDLNNRYFGGRIVLASFYDEDSFQKNQFENSA